MNVLMGNHSAERGHAYHTMGPGAYRERKLVPKLRIIKLNTKLLFNFAWGFHLGRDKDSGN